MVFEIQALSINDIWASGTFGIWHWDGISWTEYDYTSLVAVFYGMHAVSSSKVMFVDPTSSNAALWNGLSLSALPAIPADFVSLWGI
jgi:hypothetical protein